MALAVHLTLPMVSALSSSYRRRNIASSGLVLHARLASSTRPCGPIPGRAGRRHAVAVPAVDDLGDGRDAAAAGGEADLAEVASERDGHVFRVPAKVDDGALGGLRGRRQRRVRRVHGQDARRRRRHRLQEGPCRDGAVVLVRRACGGTGRGCAGWSGGAGGGRLGRLAGARRRRRGPLSHVVPALAMHGGEDDVSQTGRKRVMHREHRH